jgi:hypothetical protein
VGIFVRFSLPLLAEKKSHITGSLRQLNTTIVNQTFDDQTKLHFLTHVGFEGVISKVSK